jgi:hypothetical protein
MARQTKPGIVQLGLDVSFEAKLRFESLHASLGFKTKAQTFEAILFYVSTKDKIDPAILERIERKLDSVAELLECLL